jgi:hypothetical protein
MRASTVIRQSLQVRGIRAHQKDFSSQERIVALRVLSRARERNRGYQFKFTGVLALTCQESHAGH